jgi:hypothetical protein
MKEYQKIFVELQQGEVSMQTLLIEKSDIEDKPEILNRAYHSTFDILDGKADFLVVELLDDEDNSLISISLEPKIYELTEIVEFLKEELENGKEEI